MRSVVPVASILVVFVAFVALNGNWPEWLATQLGVRPNVRLKHQQLSALLRACS